LTNFRGRFFKKRPLYEIGSNRSSGYVFKNVVKGPVAKRCHDAAMPKV
jgi:hypothetical protein